MQPVKADSQHKQKHLDQDKNLLIIFAVSLIVVLGVSSVTLAFPKLAQALNVPQENTVLVTVFTLPAFLLGPIIGVLANQFCRKKVIVHSLFLLGIAGTACAFARDFNLLLLLRFLQGIGAALLSLSVTLIGDLFTAKRRATATGYNASVSSIGTATYPTLGNALVTMSWTAHFVFTCTYT